MIKLDHIVYFTKKSPEEVIDEQRKMGWSTIVGGRHKQWGTWNALMYLQNAYIEWLSIEHEEIAEQANHPLIEQLQFDLQNGEQWGTVCFSVNNLLGFQEQIEEEGFLTLPIIESSRTTSNGEVIRWKMLFLQQVVSSKLPLPFFIEWEVDEVQRKEQLRKNGSIMKENEELFVTECLFNVYKPLQMARLWAKILQTDVQKETDILLENVRLRFREKLTTFGNERLIDVTIEYE